LLRLPAIARYSVTALSLRATTSSPAGAASRAKRADLRVACARSRDASSIAAGSLASGSASAEPVDVPAEIALYGLTLGWPERQGL